jgi:hypothetical protein
LRQTTPRAARGGGCRPHRLRALRRAEGADAQRLSVDTGPTLRADLCLAKRSRLQARARLARPMPREAAARQPVCGNNGGFSLHAEVRDDAHDRKRLEPLCRDITRPAPSDERVNWSRSCRRPGRRRCPCVRLIRSDVIRPNACRSFCPGPRASCSRISRSGPETTGSCRVERRLDGGYRDCAHRRRPARHAASQAFASRS